MNLANSYKLIKTVRSGGGSNKELNILYANLIGRLRKASADQLEEMLQDDKIFDTIYNLVMGNNYSGAMIEDIIVSCFIIDVKEDRNK